MNVVEQINSIEIFPIEKKPLLYQMINEMYIGPIETEKDGEVKFIIWKIMIFSK